MYRKNAWLQYGKKEVKDIYKFAEGYKHFITIGKTERLCVAESIKLLREAGFKSAEEYSSLKAGDKV